MNLRCYCCGERVEGTVALVSMRADEVDRVFVMDPAHLDRAEGVTALIAHIEDYESCEQCTMK